MKISTPLLSLDARGRLGTAVVFSIWRGLNYVRTFIVPTNPNTSRQSEIRGLFTSAARAWSAISAAQRFAWRAFADLSPLHDVFGGSYTASGINAYLGLYIIAEDSGNTAVSDPPVTASPVALITPDANPGTLSGEIDIIWGGASEGDNADVWVTSLIPVGRKIQKGDYRHHSYTAMATAILTVDSLVPGGKYGVLVRAVRDNGQSGPSAMFEVVAKT